MTLHVHFVQNHEISVPPQSFCVKHRLATMVHVFQLLFLESCSILLSKNMKFVRMFPLHLWSCLLCPLLEMYSLQQIAALEKLPYKVVPICKYLQLFKY